MTSLDSFRCCKPLKVGSKTYAYYSLAGRREERPQGNFPPAVLDEGAAGKPAAQRGRPQRHQGGPPGVRAMAQDQDLRARDRVPSGARADAGFHRRAGGGRSRRHARRHEDSSAAIRRRSTRWCRSISSCDHSVAVNFFGDNNAFKKNVEEEYRQNQRALQIPEVVAEVVRQFPRRAARHRHLPPGQSRIPVADGVHQEGQGQARRQAVRRSKSPIRTRWSAPTRTPPWSTACRCSAGASAASRRKPPCSASLIRCCCPK